MCELCREVYLYRYLGTLRHTAEVPIKYRRKYLTRTSGVLLLFLGSTVPLPLPLFTFF